MDTSNEVIAIGLGKLASDCRSIELVAERSVAAHRSSNKQLIPNIEDVLEEASASYESLRCVAVGRGPGSFTGVRIAMATAKGIASALEIPLVGLSTQESIAWNAWIDGRRGRLLVLGDAMRKEVYPAFFALSDSGVERLSADKVVKAKDFAEGLAIGSDDAGTMIAGDALHRYSDLFDMIDGPSMLPEECWTPTGRGLLRALEAMLEADEGALCLSEHDPLALLPIYTRLSDAEENERARLAIADDRDLRTGVQGEDATHVSYKPMSAESAREAADMEQDLLGSDAWSETMIVDDLQRRDRTWWMATSDDRLVGYAGALVVGDEMQLLKVVVDPSRRRSGIGLELIRRVSEDARNLGAERATLEVRESNDGAISFYDAIGFSPLGIRPGYYSDGEGAQIMEAKALPIQGKQESHAADGLPRASTSHPLILAIESSCDETAAAVIDGDGNILSSIVSSQIEFHARFGGVVPEIASRKHVEAIVGVVRAALDDAGIRWRDLDAIASTYAPGLVGALVVGVAFAKGASSALGIPFIRVNHLEGHLYANRMQSDEIVLPAIASLVSGGNTLLVLIEDWGRYEILGSTIDDAVGEAFDKVAKALGLPYPGGPHISELAEQGDPSAIGFPRALMHSGDYRFSLSGLKTAVMNHIEKVRTEDGIPRVADICASFQQAVIDVQVSKAKRALVETSSRTFCLGGGVAANPALRRAYEEMCDDIGVDLVMPPLSVCGDNAAMIALVALDRYSKWSFSDMATDVAAHADISIPY